jgi:hypothetical protein
MAFELYGAGEIVQGVRGEGKSLYAVGRIQEYLLRGCPVATNLDLFLEHLLPDDNASIAYRLPDKPRLVDFQLLPSAYELDYKLADKNGLIVLDELGLWLNCRNWNDKERQGLINWLLLSRKKHWDLLLLVQDVEMVDNQIKTTLCDYLVQASRTDRQKIPYLAPLMEFLGFRAFFPKFHIYEGYYGFVFTDKPQFVRRFRGVDLYNGYDTNQLFTDGKEVIESVTGNAEIVDMRATYTYLPAAYLTKQIYVDRLQRQIDRITAIDSEDIEDMASKKKNFSSGAADKMKIVGILVMVVAYFIYRSVFSAAPIVPTANAAVSSLGQPAVVSAPSAPPSSFFASQSSPQSQSQSAIVSSAQAVDSRPPVAVKKEDFLSRLIGSYRPRLAAEMFLDKGTVNQKHDGVIEFYDGNSIAEKFTFKELRSFKVAVVSKSYGVDLITDTGTYVVSRWSVQSLGKSQPQESKS